MKSIHILKAVLRVVALLILPAVLLGSQLKAMDAADSALTGIAVTKSSASQDGADSTIPQTHHPKRHWQTGS